MSHVKTNNFMDNGDAQPEVETTSKGNDAFLESHAESEVNFDGQRPLNWGERVDRLSRVLFPLAFVTFNVSYWYTYLYKNKT
jgi:hypothetical protein